VLQLPNTVPFVHLQAAYGMREGDIEAFGALTLAQSESSDEGAYSQVCTWY
jgi:hypothetical protein